MKNEHHILICYLLLALLALWAWVSVVVLNDIMELAIKQRELSNTRWEVQEKQVEFNEGVINKFEEL